MFGLLRRGGGSSVSSGGARWPWRPQAAASSVSSSVRCSSSIGVAATTPFWPRSPQRPSEPSRRRDRVSAWTARGRGDRGRWGDLARPVSGRSENEARTACRRSDLRWHLVVDHVSRRDHVDLRGARDPFTRRRVVHLALGRRLVRQVDARVAIALRCKWGHLALNDHSSGPDPSRSAATLTDGSWTCHEQSALWRADGRSFVRVITTRCRRW